MHSVFHLFDIFILEVIMCLSYQLLITPAAALGYVCRTSAAISAHQLLHALREEQYHVVQV